MAKPNRSALQPSFLNHELPQIPDYDHKCGLKDYRDQTTDDR